MIHIPKYLSHNFRIVRLNGDEYDMRSAGILVKGFYPDAPSPVHSRETIEGRNGFIDMGTTLDGRTLHAECELRSVDIPDFTLYQDEVFRAFDSREYFYLICDAQPGKRWHVKYDSKFNIEQKAREGKFTIDLISDSPYAQSVGRTDVDPVDFDSNKWQAVGAGITLEDDLQYIWSQNSFQIYNGGDETVDPRFHELLIKFIGASNGMTITNQTTGDSFTFNQPTGSGDELDLNGPRVLLNGASALSKSNRKFIRLVPGWNDIQVSGTSGAFTISFGFRWLSL
ncbi:phage tail family protein [Sporolactobacillus sp. STSJ-5]|uniref:phage tail family protein n=1 Tax=Sporolactobacillus sp. STSJ-5 TaxID=2965076 RepID=UPI00210783D8|nr:phage tail family protein [Sporolactobacillus sp. STSJ-5]MCQ2010541.1 phage tail family protein [Sporolactobacillus sp. STSJ-5]